MGHQTRLRRMEAQTIYRSVQASCESTSAMAYQEWSGWAAADSDDCLAEAQANNNSSELPVGKIGEGAGYVLLEQDGYCLLAFRIPRFKHGLLCFRLARHEWRRWILTQEQSRWGGGSSWAASRAGATCFGRRCRAGGGACRSGCCSCESQAPAGCEVVGQSM